MVTHVQKMNIRGMQGETQEAALKWIYPFEEGRSTMRDLLGGKGAGLAEMTYIGLPVPPGFTITTEACLAYLEADQHFPDDMWDQTVAAMKTLAQKMGREFGNNENPLLVSVRSGSKFSMPGMMDTILNLGLNDEAVRTLAGQTGDVRFAMDAYRRLLQMFGKVVLGIEAPLFEALIRQAKEEAGVKTDPEVPAVGWRKVVSQFEALIEEKTGSPFPQEPWVQLEMAVGAVFESWNGKRAIDYRNAVGISHDLGTANNIMAMVFGNMGTDSASGVAFTRNPSTGEKVLFGEYLINAQGEDVVSGARTPAKIAQMVYDLPEAWQTLQRIAETLECHYHEMQDIEFTIEHGRLWMLQTRNGKRSAAAATKIAADMVFEGLISVSEAVSRIEPNQIDQLLHPRFDETPHAAAPLLAHGINASPGAAVGMVIFDADTVERIVKEESKSVILVRPETNPDDVHGMLAAKGILTQHGGATSHAAVVARQLGKPCVAGCDAIGIDLEQRCFRVGETIVREGDIISIDGSRGDVYLGALPTVTPSFTEMTDLQVILQWADELSRLQVWANADDPEQARRARQYGAQGIGLCRTEHMFLGERTELFQKAILAPTQEEFCAVLNNVLLPLQRQDFFEIFREMDGLPVIIRLLDPPLHEFLPSLEDLIAEVAEMDALGSGGPRVEHQHHLLTAVREMHEINPMLGLRGCRLGIMRPALNTMQVRAIFEAACDAALDGIDVHPEVMIPLTSHINELREIQPLLEQIANEVMRQKEIEVSYKFGTMIEIPRAAVTAGEIAELAQFFSFGTNDLTQMTFGISRDDAERKFLLSYVERGILPENPFQTIDQQGVGLLMERAVTDGRKTRPDLEIGICGEHGGDPASVEFCHRIGLNYVSCSPFRVPIARLAAAHAALHELREGAQDL
jgi:pyruvate, orthophosphate dikinase